MARTSRKKTVKAPRNAIGTALRKTAKRSKKRKTRKKAASPKRVENKRYAPERYEQLGLNEPYALLTTHAPSTKEVDDCVRDWLSWLHDRAPGYGIKNPFPDYIDAEELDGRLDNLAQKLKALDPLFDLSRFVNGKTLLTELGTTKSIGFFVGRIYFYALRACGLKA